MQNNYSICLEVDANGEECAIVSSSNKVRDIILLENNNLEETCAKYFKNSIHNQEDYLGEKQ